MSGAPEEAGVKRGGAAAGLAGLMVAGGAAFRLRRRLIGRALRLPPPRNGVAVERDIAVPMPDGVTLMADHYAPRTAAPCPTILIRTPYGRGREAGVFGLVSISTAQRFAERGYHVLVQGTRGRFDSGGVFEPNVNEAADGRSTVAWLEQQPWFNGALGMWGPSYLGYVQWAVAVAAPPVLKAIVPGITFSRGRTVTYPDGVFSLNTALRWSFLLDALDRRPRLAGLARTLRQEQILAPAFSRLPVRDADQVATGGAVSFYQDWLNHPSPDDPYWAASDLSAGVANVTAATHLISGWYDFVLRELLEDYGRMRAAGKAPHLTVGPWTHFSQDGMAAQLREGVRWFDGHLRGGQTPVRQRPVHLHVMGAGVWREFDGWPPPARPVRYYPRAGGRLTTDPAGNDPPDHYRYDPAGPTPALGGAWFHPNAGPVDNRQLESRADVLHYTSAPLTADLEVIGPVRLELFARSSVEHTDFFGRLCDVGPDGRSINVCDGLVRLTPKHGDRQPDGSLRVVIDLWATAYRFRHGHRLRLQLSSGAHPRWNRNLGAGEPEADAATPVPADQTIYHDAEHPTALVLPVIEGG